ncbi:MI domain-containing protein [Entamoeba marina]
MSELEVKKVVRGQFNRLSESSLDSTTTTLTKYFQTYPRAYMTSSITDTLSKLLPLYSQAPEQILLLSSVIAVLSGTVDIGIAGSIITEICLPPITAEKCIFLSGLYGQKVITSTLLFDIISQALKTKDANIADAIISYAGVIMRKEDPRGIGKLIETARSSEQTSSASDVSVRWKYVVDCLNDLKNNKFVSKGDDIIERHKKQIRPIWKRSGVVKGFELDCNLETVQNKTNRWWESGSGHSEVQIQAVELSGDIGGKMARAHHMNTEVRKAVFVAIMEAQDYVDGITRLESLNLKKEQEREIIYVLMYCVGQAKKYNVYYQLIAEAITKKSKASRFTLQLALFDRLRDIDNFGARAAMNWGTLLGALIVKDFMTLLVLKGIDMLALTTVGVVFVRSVLNRILIDDNTEGVVHCFRRFVGFKDNDAIKLRRSVHLFLMKQMGKCQDSSMKKLREKRRQTAIKIMDSAVDSLL